MKATAAGTTAATAPAWVQHAQSVHVIEHPCSPWASQSSSQHSMPANVEITSESALPAPGTPNERTKTVSMRPQKRRAQLGTRRIFIRRLPC